MSPRSDPPSFVASGGGIQPVACGGGIVEVASPNPVHEVLCQHPMPGIAADRDVVPRWA